MRALAAVLTLLLSGCEATPARFDAIIRGGRVFDGVATQPQRVDVGITGDRISRLGDLADVDAPIVIDARNAIVTPGFIDVQSRAGVSLLAEGHGESHLRQGVTTVIIGDLDSPAFWSRSSSNASLLAPFDVPFDWTGAEGYIERLAQRGTSMNVATLVPLSAIDRTASAIDAAMRQGAIGLSLVYDAQSSTSPSDLDVLGMVAARRGVVAVHLRGSLDEMRRALDEVLRVANQTRASLVVYDPGLSDAADYALLLSRIADARAKGVTVGTTMTPPASEVAPAAAYWFRDSGASVGSQTHAVRAGGLLSRKSEQPRAYDVFANVLARYVREKDTLSLGHAIRQMTSNAAAQFHLENRGAIRVGHVADLVVLDADAIAGPVGANGGGEYATGVHTVFVNGVVVLDRTGITGARPGRAILGPSRATEQPR
jgi:N-acyl-D-amino-acid deacylase